MTTFRKLIIIFKNSNLHTNVQQTLIKTYANNNNIKLFISGIVFNEGSDNDFHCINENVVNWCVGNHICYFDVFEHVSSRSKYFYDNLHLNEVGSDFVSDRIFNVIKDQLNTSLTNLHTFPICSNRVLNETMMWSEWIDINNLSTLVLWLDTFVEKKISYNSALYVVDCMGDGDFTESGLTYSDAVGWFSYIDLQKEGFTGMQFLNIKIPKNIYKLRIGIRRWRSEALININNSYITCIEKSREFNC